MRSVRQILEPLRRLHPDVEVRRMVTRCGFDLGAGLRAGLAGLEDTRPTPPYFEYDRPTRRAVQRRTREVLDEYTKIDGGQWHSYLHRNVIPMRIAGPTSLSDLQRILREAGSARVRVKAVGSGHSFSDIYRTDGWLIDTHGLHGSLPLHREWLKATPVGIDGQAVDPGRQLAEVLAGTTIRALNDLLDRRGQALLNAGGYDGQTLIGAASTSTHGTGIGLPPFCDMILSLVLVSEGGRTYRIEPDEGITDPARYPATEPELVQDDDIFNSVIVSMGCMGVVHSAIIQVRSRYFLRETVHADGWNVVRRDLESHDFRPPLLTDHRHLNVVINPYASVARGPLRGRLRCMVTTTDRVPHVLIEGEPRRNDNHWIVRGVRTLRFQKPDAVADAYNVGFDLAAAAPSFESRSYKTFIAPGKEIGGYACEWSFSLDRYLKAVAVILDTVNRAAADGEQVQTAPISLRFVKQSRAYLSPQFGRDSCMIELLNLYGTPGWPTDYALMHRFFDALSLLGGRPHWGLEFNDLLATDDIGALYPRWSAWLRTYERFNRTGVFNNEFTDRLGISM